MLLENKIGLVGVQPIKKAPTREVEAISHWIWQLRRASSPFAIRNGAIVADLKLVSNPYLRYQAPPGFTFRRTLSHPEETNIPLIKTKRGRRGCCIIVPVLRNRLLKTLEESPLDQTKLLQRGLWLEYATLGWNVIGCWIVLGAALATRSVALAGFGLDSVIEIFASVSVVWQLKAINKDKEELAERLIGVAFLLLALYILAQSAYTLVSQQHPDTSPIGIFCLAVTALAMFLLAYGKGRTGEQLGNVILQKESKITVIDGMLAVAVLAGILLNALVGFWWADPLAGLVIVYYGIKEGIHALMGST